MSYLVSQQPVHSKPQIRKDDYEPLPVKWSYVLELKLAGATEMEIRELTGYSPAMVYRILADDRVKLIKQQMMDVYEFDFEVLYGDVVNTIRDGLKSDDMDERLSAARLWLKEFGPTSKAKQQIEGGGGNTNISAEQVVFNILNQK